MITNKLTTWRKINFSCWILNCYEIYRWLKNSFPKNISSKQLPIIYCSTFSVHCIVQYNSKFQILQLSVLKTRELLTSVGCCIPLCWFCDYAPRWRLSEADLACYRNGFWACWNRGCCCCCIGGPLEFEAFSMLTWTSELSLDSARTW